MQALAPSSHPLGENQSVWLSEIQLTQYEPLRQHIGEGTFDVVVIGAGITGLTTAMRLKRDGMRVAVLEQHQVGTGTTGHSTGHLTTVVDSRYQDIEKSFSPEQAQLVYRSMSEAIDHIEANSREYGIDCNFERISGYLYAEPSQDVEEVPNEFPALVRAGCKGAEMLAGNTIGLPFPVANALAVPNLAQFHPAKYCVGMAKALHGNGCVVFERTRVTNVHDSSEQCTVECGPNASVKAKHIVMATHTPIGLHVTMHTAVYPMRSYVMAVRVSQQIPAGLFWDTAEPYHYIRRHSASRPDVLIVGGCDHKTGQAEEAKHFTQLEQYVRERFSVSEVLTRWSAQYYDTTDGLPYIGQLPGNSHTWIGTGYLGEGLTWGTVAGLMLADEMRGVPNAYSKLYSPSRFKPVAGAPRFIKENMNVMKHFVGDRFNWDAREFEAIAIGDGGIVQQGLHKVAVYRDVSGKVHACSAVCTHMGCIVKFNQAEKTWDCPCHGARYDTCGKVIEGPALQDLEDLVAAKPSTHA